MKQVPRNRLNKQPILFEKNLTWIQQNRITLWIDDLRSEKYCQGYGNLKTSEGTFCCLGVANECLGLGEKDNDILYTTYPLLGLIYSNGAFRNSITSLAELNDIEGWSFEDLATEIENQLAYATRSPRQKIADFFKNLIGK